MKDKNGIGINQPIESGGGHTTNHQMVWVEELSHYSQKGIEEYHNNWQVEEEHHHLMAMVMVIVMVVEEVIRPPPPKEKW